MIFEVDAMARVPVPPIPIPPQTSSVVSSANWLPTAIATRPQAEKSLLLTGDDISPNKLTMPPIAIECVRHIQQEAVASFWEACHIAKQNVTKPNHIWFLGFVEEFVRAFDAATETGKKRSFCIRISRPRSAGATIRAIRPDVYRVLGSASEPPGGHWS
jgi:hypothetical protein